MRWKWIAALTGLVLSTAAGPTLAQGPQTRFDDATGRDLAHWPPDRLFDFLHMRLAIQIPDMDTPSFSAEETLTVRPIAVPRSSIDLDARSMLHFSAVTVDGAPATFTHEHNHLLITLPHAAQPGANVTLVLTYTGGKTEVDSSPGVGVNWFPRQGATTAQIYTQGESDWNSCWFACHDFPNAKMTTELLVTVPDGYDVISNGRLVGVTQGPGPAAAPSGSTPPNGHKPLVTWHWLQDKPIAAYLVTMVVGAFDVVTIPPSPTAKLQMSRPIPLAVYAPRGSGAEARTNFARTPDMIAFFEHRFGTPYPWDKYSQLLVRDFHWGGMENASATNLADNEATGPGDKDELISHELAHQWFGDLVTCKSWEHLWLNEGWATYCEALWAEQRDGEEGYYRIIREKLMEMRMKPFEPAPNAVPMVSNRWVAPDDTFTKVDDVYAKGGLILHMLRQRLGDDAFFGGTKLYLARFRYRSAETADFRRCLEEVSGQSLERFFDQWTTRPGLPQLAVKAEWDDATSKLKITIDQEQPINEANPAFAFTLPIYIDRDDNLGTWLSIDTDTRHAEATYTLVSKPKHVSVDPYVTIAAKVTLSSDLAQLPGLPAKAASQPVELSSAK